MSPELLEWVVLGAGLLHFTQIPAMLMVPKTLDWEAELGRLTPINRQLFRVVVGGIVICVLGLGLVVALSSHEMVTTRLGWRLSVFLVCFWSYRSAIQWFVYRKTWPANARYAHVLLSFLFPGLAIAYGLNVLSGV